MLATWILLTSASIGAIASPGYTLESAEDPHFRYNLRKRAENVTSFNGPYSTQGRDIVDSQGQKVTWAGVNWPMSGTSSRRQN
jgi:endoglucanase